MLLLAGCGAVPADSAGAYGQQRWIAEDGSFGVEYLAPPWTPVDTDDPDRLELEVPPEFFGVSIDSESPSHVFQVGHVDMLGELGEFASEDLEMDTDWVGDTEDLPGVEGQEVLDGVDLHDPYAVARAELDVLLEDHDAQLDYGLSTFGMPTGAQAVEFQILMDPGLYVRAFYIDARPTVVRATFVSLFDLDTDDVSTMARTIDTLDPGDR